MTIISTFRFQKRYESLTKEEKQKIYRVPSTEQVKRKIKISKFSVHL